MNISFLYFCYAINDYIGVCSIICKGCLRSFYIPLHISFLQRIIMWQCQWIGGCHLQRDRFKWKILWNSYKEDRQLNLPSNSSYIYIYIIPHIFIFGCYFEVFYPCALLKNSLFSHYFLWLYLFWTLYILFVCVISDRFLSSPSI